jgi:hypothetical protein
MDQAELRDGMVDEWTIHERNALVNHVKDDRENGQIVKS